jgi:selenocysteine-specific elongation factor
LADGFTRLRLDRPLPLRVGDRAILRDPGSRTIWGVEVLDPQPPPLSRRGAAAARAAQLRAWDSTLLGEVRRRGVVRRSELIRQGVPDGPLADGTVAVGDWLVSPERAADLRRELVAVVRKSSTPFEPGMTLDAAARALGLEEPGLVPELGGGEVRVEAGRVVAGGLELPAAVTGSLAELRAHLQEHPFGAPDAARLAELGLDPAALAALARAGQVLRIGDTVLLPGADALACEVLRTLPQPFTTSEARQALATTRRVALPLLAHLDHAGFTVRLPDDRRRIR